MPIDQTPSSHATRFPSLAGKTLEKQPTKVPEDLDGTLNLLFVPFLQRQQLHVNTWLRRLGDAEERFPGLAMYEIPLLREFPTFYRQWIDSGMRNGIPDRRTRERTITVYTDRPAFLRNAGLADTSDIWVALVDQDGMIYWSHVGRPTPDAVASLEWSLEHLT